MKLFVFIFFGAEFSLSNHALRNPFRIVFQCLQRILNPSIEIIGGNARRTPVYREISLSLQILRAAFRTDFRIIKNRQIVPAPSPASAKDDVPFIQPQIFIQERHIVEPHLVLTVSVPKDAFQHRGFSVSAAVRAEPLSLQLSGNAILPAVFQILGKPVPPPIPIPHRKMVHQIPYRGDFQLSEKLFFLLPDTPNRGNVIR